jgi:hypothetical protein
VEVQEQKRRRQALRRVARGVARGLLLTEGTCEPFPPSVLQELASELPVGLKWWILATWSAESRRVEDLSADRWRIVDCRLLKDEALRLAPERLRRFEAQAVVGHAPPELGAVWLLRRVRRSNA